MKTRLTVSVVLGLIAMACWTAYTVFLMSDLYLDYPVAGIALRMLVPWALLTNIVGMIIALIRGRRDGKLMPAVGLILNLLPPAVAAGFLAWLLFGFRM